MGDERRHGANGAETVLSANGYEAAVVQRGAGVRYLRHEGRDLIAPYAADQHSPLFRGALVAPWPNRIADGRYTFDGQTLQLAVNEEERNTALHGLVYDRMWAVGEPAQASVTLTHTIEPTGGYPFSVDVAVTYALDRGGFHTTVTASNTGSSAAPYGVCPHPYLIAGLSGLDQWTLELHARWYLEVTPDRLLPVRMREAEGGFDFRSPQQLGGLELDHAFTDLAYDGGTCAAVVRDPAGTGVQIQWDQASPWVQVHTADRPEPEYHRAGLAVEPMTCPPDAFNSGVDLVRLEPGASHTARWTIAAV
jgi:aldose 1-epimerase